MGHTELGSLPVAGKGGLGGTTSTSLKTIPLPNPPHKGEMDNSLVHAYLEGEGLRPTIHSYDRPPKPCAMQMEGIVSKNVAAPNRSGRNESWLKIKCER